MSKHAHDVCREGMDRSLWCALSTEQAQKAPEFGLVNFIIRIWHMKSLQLVRATKHGLVLVGFSDSSLLLAWRYNSGRILAFSTIPFHLR